MLAWWYRDHFYRFTKGLTQNLNLRTNVKLEYNINSLNYIQQTFSVKASFLFYLLLLCLT